MKLGGLIIVDADEGFPVLRITVGIEVIILALYRRLSMSVFGVKEGQGLGLRMGAVRRRKLHQRRPAELL